MLRDSRWFCAPPINGFTNFGRKDLAKQLNATGALPAGPRCSLAAALAERFPIAQPPLLDNHG